MLSILLCAYFNSNIKCAYFRRIAKDAYQHPLTFNVDGVVQTHRVIVTMYKMDTQEYHNFCSTKKINAHNSHGCARCCDDRAQITDPNHYSFQFPRSNNHILELAGFNTDNVDIPISDSDVCKTWESWNEKGFGYFPKDVSQIQTDDIISDPHYSIKTDIYHGLKNVLGQYFPTIVRLSSNNHREFAFRLFQQIMDFLKLNHIEAKNMLTIDGNWKKDGHDYIKDISLEIAPWALV